MSPAFVRVNPGDPVQAQNLDQVIDALNGTTAKGVPIAVTAVNDTSNYALTVQNVEPTSSRALNVLNSGGTSMVRVDSSGVTLGSPLNLAAGSITTPALADRNVTNAKLASDTARANLLTDGGFEIWQRGNGPFTAANAYCADRWQVYVPGGTTSVSKQTTAANIDVGGASAGVTTTAPAGFGNGLFQVVDANSDFPQIRNRTVTVSIRIKCSQASSVRVGLEGDKAVAGPSVFSSYHTGGGAFETLTATITLGVVNGLTVWVTGQVAGTWYADNAMLVVGSVPADYAPLHPADDLARSQRYYEVIPMQTIVIGGYAAAGARNFGSFQWVTTKPVAPTVTVSAAATWSALNASTPPTSFVGSQAFTLATVATATGEFFVQGLSTASVIGEANP